MSASSRFRQVCAIAGFALLCSALPSQAAVITFEDLGVASGTQLNPLPGVGIVSFGFNYTPGPNNASGFNDLHMDHDTGINASNRSTVGSSHDDVVLSRVGGSGFSLSQFDFAGFPRNFETRFTVVGSFVGGGTIMTSFTPDGIVDGIGGAVDFQTFLLGPGWVNLASVTWNHTGLGTNAGLFALDNIHVDDVEPIPEPASVLLLASGLLGLARRRQRG